MSKAQPTPVKGRSTETVYRSVNTTSAAGVLHTDRDCPSLSSARRVREVERGQYPGVPICKHCTGEADRGREQSDLAARLRHADSAAEAMAADSLAELTGGETA